MNFPCIKIIVGRSDQRRLLGGGTSAASSKIYYFTRCQGQQVCLSNYALFGLILKSFYITLLSWWKDHPSKFELKCGPWKIFPSLYINFLSYFAIWSSECIDLEGRRSLIRWFGQGLKPQCLKPQTHIFYPCSHVSRRTEFSEKTGETMFMCFKII